MDISLKSILPLVAVIFTGLSAGLFYAWSVSVIPGTKKITDLVYLETMQSINRAILNPAFFLIFFGSLVLLSIASIYTYNTPNSMAFGCMLAATVAYLTGTVGVTGLGNVPLNDQLDQLNLVRMDTEEIRAFRRHYEARWNQLHQIRMVFAVLSFCLAVVALVMHSRKV